MGLQFFTYTDFYFLGIRAMEVALRLFSNLPWAWKFWNISTTSTLRKKATIEKPYGLGALSPLKGFFFSPPKLLNRRVYSTARHSPLISLKTSACPILVFGIPPVYRRLRNCVIDSNMVAGLVVNSPSTNKLVIELNVLGELATWWNFFVFLSPLLNQSTLNLSPTNLLQDSCLFEPNLKPILI